MAVNPFVWSRPLDDPAKIVGMDGFAQEVALILKGQTNVALFGPRDTGKTTFTVQLAEELQRSHGDDAPAHTVLTVNLQRCFSIPAFIGCVHDALTTHPSRKIQREARRHVSVVEKEIGFDIKVIKGSMRRTGVTTEQDVEALHALLRAITKLDGNVVVIFDEFQHLNRCPENPLGVIRSALMGTGANHVSLLFTGSIREALRMMLEKSDEPIFGEAHQMELPAIAPVDFLEYLDFNFSATGRTTDEQALNHLLNLTNCHPKRTQQLAWGAWEATKGRRIPLVDVEIVQSAYDRMLGGSDAAPFEAVVQMLGSGDEGEANEMRALFMLADRGGAMLTSRQNVALYGFTNASLIVPAVERLRRRGLTQKSASGEWEIVDPFFTGWLRQQSPLALRPGDAPAALPPASGE
jgi:hypothetical protein